MTTDVNLHAWAGQTAEAYRNFEQHELAMYPSRDHRDSALVEWVLRVLARPENAGTAQVLEAIDRQRASVGAS
jgi:hypothetical protein